MKKLIKILLIFISLSLNTLKAQNGYDYYYYGNGGSNYVKLNKTAIIKIAKAEIKRLLLRKKIPSSWKGIDILTINKENSSDWKVIFNNIKVKEKSKQNIYIFIDVYGKMVGINYTGK